jgi:soluble lytic murein transglycosylase-like protein
MVFVPPPDLPPTAGVSAHVSKANPAPHGWTGYRVRPGDTLIGIAARYRTSPWTLAAHNRITNTRALQVGARIEVPRGAPARQQSARKARTAPKEPTPRTTRAVKRTASVRTGTLGVRVHRGDTLSGIAAAYRTTVPALLKLNGRSSTTIYAGERLVVPTTRAAATRKGPAKPTAKRAPKATTKARAKRPVRQAPNTFGNTVYPQAVANAAARNRSTLAALPVPNRSQTRDLIIKTARTHGVDPKLALAISWQESGWNHRQVSVANAIGIMQVIPAGGQWASDLTGQRLNLLNPRDNVTAGVVMLRALTRATGSEDLAIASYYQGLGSVTSRGMYTDTRQYVRNVKALKGRM